MPALHCHSESGEEIEAFRHEESKKGTKERERETRVCVGGAKDRKQQGRRQGRVFGFVRSDSVTMREEVRCINPLDSLV